MSHDSWDTSHELEFIRRLGRHREDIKTVAREAPDTWIGRRPVFLRRFRETGPVDGPDLCYLLDRYLHAAKRRQDWAGIDRRRVLDAVKDRIAEMNKGRGT